MFSLLDICKTSSSQISRQMTTAHYLPSLPLLFLIAVHTFLPFYLKRNTRKEIHGGANSNKINNHNLFKLIKFVKSMRLRFFENLSN